MRRLKYVLSLLSIGYGLLLPLVAEASTYSPTVLVNTESFTIIDDAGGGTNVELRFGDTVNESLIWNNAASRFEFSNAVYVANNLAGSGTLRIEGDMATKANMYINADNGATDAALSFGNDTLAESLVFERATSRFAFSDDVYVNGNLGTSGTLDVTGTTLLRADTRVRGTMSSSLLKVDNLTVSGGVLYTTQDQVVRTLDAGSTDQVLTSQGGKTPIWSWQTGAKLLHVPNPLVTISNNNTETAIVTLSIPANLLTTNRNIHVRIAGQYTNNTGANQTFTMRTKYGATTLFADSTLAMATSAVSRPLYLDLTLGNKNATNAQSLGGYMIVSNNTAGTNGLGDLGTDEIVTQTAIVGTSAIDSTANQTFQITLQLSSASVAHTFVTQYAVVEIW